MTESFRAGLARAFVRAGIVAGDDGKFAVWNGRGLTGYRFQDDLDGPRFRHLDA